MKNKILIILLLISFTGISQTLEEYIVIAKTNNSELKSVSNGYEIAEEKVNEVGNLGDTNFSLGYFALQPETRVGAQNTKFGVSQILPWFGTLNAEREVAKSIANKERYEIQLSERALAYQVKIAYYQIYEQLAITNILKDNKLILKTYESMALSALENNKATMSDVLRIRVQKNELHSKTFQNINSIETQSSNFNLLLERDKITPLYIVDSLNVLDASLKKESVNEHPILLQLSEKQKIYSAKQQLIGKNSKPKIEIGLDYVIVNERSDVSVLDNGKDIFMPKIGLKIPIFTKKYKSQNKQIKLLQDQLNSELKTEQKKLNIAFETAILENENSIVAVVAAQKNKSELQQAINVDLKAYETGILNYDKILRLQLQKIKFQLMEIKAIKEAFIAKSKIEYLSK